MPPSTVAAAAVHESIQDTKHAAMASADKDASGLFNGFGADGVANCTTGI